VTRCQLDKQNLDKLAHILAFAIDVSESGRAHVLCKYLGQSNQLWFAVKDADGEGKPDIFPMDTLHFSKLSEPDIAFKFDIYLSVLRSLSTNIAHFDGIHSSSVRSLDLEFT